MLTQPITDDAQLHAALESIQPGDGHANFGELGRAVRALAEDVARSHRSASLQRHAAQRHAGQLCRHGICAEFRQAHPASGSEGHGAAELDRGKRRRSRRAVRSERSEACRALQAVIAGFNTPAATKNVSLVSMAKSWRRKKVDIPANGRATVEFAPLNVDYGFNRCSDAESKAAMHFRLTMPASSPCAAPIPSACSSCIAARPTLARRLLSGRRSSAAAQSSFVLQSVAAEQATDLDPSQFAFVVLSDTYAFAAVDL